LKWNANLRTFFNSARAEQKKNKIIYLSLFSSFITPNKSKS